MLKEAVLVGDLRMRYGDKDVLQGVGFAVGRGEVVALLGPNGAGKTTTIEILEGFRLRSGGTVAVLGADPARGDERWRARLGIVLQSWRDHPKWRVRELLAVQGAYYAPYAAPDVPRPWPADALLAAVGLTEQADAQVRTLSGGQRRRLDVAIGLVGRPEVLFLDEATAGLDPQARREFHDLIRRVADEFAMTIMLTTHDLAEAEQLADRIVILAGGRVLADGTAAQLAREFAGQDEVRWTCGGERFTRAAPDGTALAFELFTRHGTAVRDMEIRRASLEDTYLAIVRKAEEPTP
jgi:ABC-2 type transport system ATP-binding protein